MEYYCIMIQTGEEKAFREAAVKAVDAKVYSFERKLFTKRRGWFTAPLFPGYVFLEVESLLPLIVETLKKIKGFCRILRDNQNPVKITGHALEELEVFIKNGENWGISKVKFLPGQKIAAVSGPLKGLEGNIIAVNKKKKQITVQSSLTFDGKKFDLLYEDAEMV
ncbi:MAG: hypothetical protein J6Y36_07635 [Treponema sp.]|uniref:transcription termination/antitermination NusG family protein n=1 Tax=Treponema sp. TaxID=166 RepID=UPI001B50DFAF|nr:transcription termination/antitermination NusG family protein [Treponema sp.]MBP5403012.1 hypothetical protein [Treponema sp.]MBR5934231.1 hypothetical protein [Treponema sp.]